jgi:hypothetical protein
MVLTHPGVSYAQDDFGKFPGDYPYLFSRVVGQSHWPSLQTKPPNMIGLLPSFGANKPAEWTYEQSPELPIDKTEHLCYY